MSRIKQLEANVRELYESKIESRETWADWLYAHHVFLVAEQARRLAECVDAEQDLCEAAGMLHDIADAEMSRFDTRHAVRSLEIAHVLLAESGFSSQEITIIDDALIYHGCRDGVRPKTQVGKVMATADAVVHLTSDFYEYADMAHRHEGMSEEESRAWTIKKIERDFNDKILFSEVKEQVREEYERLKTMFA